MSVSGYEVSIEDYAHVQTSPRARGTPSAPLLFRKRGSLFVLGAGKPEGVSFNRKGDHVTSQLHSLVVNKLIPYHYITIRAGDARLGLGQEFDGVV